MLLWARGGIASAPLRIPAPDLASGLTLHFSVAPLGFHALLSPLVDRRAPMAGKRFDPPRRQRGARSDASVGSIEKDIERTYGLPPDSVQINKPMGRDARSDKTIGKLKKEY